MTPGWKYLGDCYDSEPFEIEGINIWDHPWTTEPGKVEFQDRIWGQDRSFDIVSITADGKTIRFAAGEFSANAWGFLIPEQGALVESTPSPKPQKRKLWIPIFLLIGLAFWIGGGIVTYNAAKTSRWPSVMGTIIAGPSYSERPSGKSSRAWDVSIYYFYIVDGKTYEGSRISIPERSYTTIEEAKSVNEVHNNNPAIKVYYNPSNPKEAVLRPGVMGEYVVAILFGGGLFFVPAFIVLMRNKKVNRQND
ncbi:MAG: DUF3592 domain-containing protein [Armatimonadetes bacterium]|nr:DUF3592 domain-containing protein [Armatimonadota bacterium]